MMSILLMSFMLQAQDSIKNVNKNKKEKVYNEKGELIKKGWNIGPLPVVGYNSDLGFQYGACVDIFNYGDGSRYPNFDYKMNLEVSAFTTFVSMAIITISSLTHVFSSMLVISPTNVSNSTASMDLHLLTSTTSMS